MPESTENAKMTLSGFFLLTLFCLGWTREGASSAKQVKRLQFDSRFGTTLDAAKRLLWKSFSAENRVQDNYLFFPIPFARDLVFIDGLLSEGAKKNVQRFLTLYKGIEEDLTTFGNELRKGSANDTRFKTILYINSIELYKTLDALIHPVYKNPAYPKESFQVIVKSGKSIRRSLDHLLQSVKDSKLGFTCEVRFCEIEKILLKKPPFAMVTLASWRVRHVDGFQWSEIAKYTFYETNTIDVRTLRSVAKFDYAEFQYPQVKGCTGRVLRIPYNSKFHLNFVIPSDERNCSTLEEEWKNFQEVDLVGLEFKGQEMFVSIPVFSVSASTDFKTTVTGTDLAKVFTRKSSTLYKALAFIAAEFIFDPKLPETQLSPMISPKTPTFHLDRPFFLSIDHISSGTVVFAGFVFYPGCIRSCEHQPSNG